MIKEENKKPTLLLHSCCAPCSTTAIFTLLDKYDITICYYNPNIYPYEEYIKRKGEEIKFLDELKKDGKANISMLDVDWESEKYNEIVKGLEQEKEGGARCEKCFLLRLEKVAKLAKENSFYFFATTLTVSPHKNAELINSIGKELEKKYGVSYLETNLKKNDGYKKSVEYSKEFNLYRQNYCGCKYSMWWLK